MSDQADRETMGDDLGVWSVDAEDQLQPEDTLDGQGDVLDRGYTAGYHYQGAVAHGVTAAEQSREETIDQRIRQEVPDPSARYDDGTARTRARSAEDGDNQGDDSQRVGRMVSPDEGHYPDHEARMIAREWRAASWDSPEESAMHYVNGDGEESELTEVEWQPSDEPPAGDDE